MRYFHGFETDLPHALFPDHLLFAGSFNLLPTKNAAIRRVVCGRAKTDGSPPAFNAGHPERFD